MHPGYHYSLRQVYGAAREQRCWVHKTGNILLPKGLLSGSIVALNASTFEFLHSLDP